MMNPDRITRRNLACKIVAIFTVSALISGCSTDDIRRVREGADTRLDIDKSSDLQTRTLAVRNNFRDILGLKESPALSDVLTAEQSSSVLHTGYAYVDQQCSVYFNALLHIQRDAHAVSTELAVLGTAATAILALSGAGVAAAGIGAAVTGAAVATANNVGSDLLFALDAGSTHGLTMRAMAAYANSAPAQPGAVHTYGDAFAIISGYALQCSPPRIESLVKEAVDKAKPGDSTGSPDPQRKAIEAVTEILRARLAKDTGLPELTAQEAILLYLQFVTDSGSATTPDNNKIMIGTQARLEKLNKDVAAKIYKKDAAGKVSMIISTENKTQTTNGLQIIGYVDSTVPSDALKIKEEISNPKAPPAAETPAPPAPSPTTKMVPDIQIMGYAQ